MLSYTIPARFLDFYHLVYYIFYSTLINGLIFNWAYNMKRFFKKNKKTPEKKVNITAEDIRKQRSTIERRTTQDRRSAYDLDYFDKEGVERRKGDERRKRTEKRTDWVRAEKWRSVFVGEEEKSNKK